MTGPRSTREVLDDHLALAANHDLETDLARNFAEEVVLLTGYGIFRGIDGVREKADLLAKQLPGGRWTYETVSGLERARTAPGSRTAPIPFSSGMVGSAR